MKKSDQDKAALVARQLGARVRDARQAHKITLTRLSELTGLSAGFLSRLERGETNASISNLIAISGALGIALRDFFDEPPPPAGPRFVLTRAAERGKKAPLRANGYTYCLSSADLPDQQMSAFELTFPPQAKAAPPRLVTHPGEEVLFLLEGAIEFRIGDDTFVMNPGDCVHFDCEEPHMGRNIGRTPARLLMIVTPVHSIRPS
jgi:transcriptional regulator with XRE-family HTH domain